MAEEKKDKKPDTLKCEVLRGIGVAPSPEIIAHEKMRAKQRGREFVLEGLTEMLYPNKPIYKDNGKTIIDPEPVFVDLDRGTARKLQKAGAVRVDI